LVNLPCQIHVILGSDGARLKIKDVFTDGAAGAERNVIANAGPVNAALEFMAFKNILSESLMGL
jgi:ABC-type hemin transport system substrate-binding protein